MEQTPEQEIVRLFFQLVIEGKSAGKAWHKIMSQLADAARDDKAFQTRDPKPYIKRLERLNTNMIGLELYDFSMPPVSLMRADWREERRGWRDAFGYVFTLGAFGEIRRTSWPEIMQQVSTHGADEIPERDTFASTGYRKAAALLEWLQLVQIGLPNALVQMSAKREQMLRIPMRALMFTPSETDRLSIVDLDGILAHIYARRD